MMSFALTACGPQCWEAKEDVCSCSCGGANYGIHRHKRPDCHGLRRQMVYEGFIFELASFDKPEDRGSGLFGPDLTSAKTAKELNIKAGIKFHFAHTARDHFGEFPVAITRPATESQIAKWPELAPWRGKVNGMYGRPNLLWTRRDDLTQQVHANLKKS